MGKTSVKEKIERLLNDALSYREKESAKCEKVAKILRKEYGYPEGISVMWQDADGYVIVYEDDPHIDNIGVCDGLEPYEKKEWI